MTFCKKRDKHDASPISWVGLCRSERWQAISSSIWLILMEMKGLIAVELANESRSVTGTLLTTQSNKQRKCFWTKTSSSLWLASSRQAAIQDCPMQSQFLSSSWMSRVVPWQLAVSHCQVASQPRSIASWMRPGRRGLWQGNQEQNQGSLQSYNTVFLRYDLVSLVWLDESSKGYPAGVWLIGALDVSLSGYYCWGWCVKGE